MKFMHLLEKIRRALTRPSKERQTEISSSLTKELDELSFASELDWVRSIPAVDTVSAVSLLEKLIRRRLPSDKIWRFDIEFSHQNFFSLESGYALVDSTGAVVALVSIYSLSGQKE